MGDAEAPRRGCYAAPDGMLGEYIEEYGLEDPDGRNGYRG